MLLSRGNPLSEGPFAKVLPGLRGRINGIWRLERVPVQNASGAHIWDAYGVNHNHIGGPSRVRHSLVKGPSVARSLAGQLNGQQAG
jgi:hypothetical protein